MLLISFLNLIKLYLKNNLETKQVLSTFVAVILDKRFRLVQIVTIILLFIYVIYY